MRGGDGFAQVLGDQPLARVQQAVYQRLFHFRIGLRILHPLHHDAQQLGDGVAHRVLRDGNDEPPLIVTVEQLLVGRLPADVVGELRVLDHPLAQVARHADELHVAQQHIAHRVGEVGLLRHLLLAGGDKAEEGAVEIEEAQQDLLVFMPEILVVQPFAPVLQVPARQPLRIAGYRQGDVIPGNRLQDLQIQPLEKLHVNVRQVPQEQRVVPRIGEVHVVRVGILRLLQRLHRKHDEVVVNHADGRHARLVQRPGGIQRGLAAHHHVPRRVGILLQHVVDEDGRHLLPHLARLARHLVAPHGAAQRVEDLARGVKDDGSVELHRMADELAIHQQVFGRAEQAVFLRQVLQVGRRVEELHRRHALRHVDGDFRMRRGDALRCRLLRHGIL